MDTSSMPGDATGVVLAGGKSLRMGRDKAGLAFRGRSLLDHMLDLLAQGGVHPSIVSGQYADYPCVPDAFPDGGPIAGMLAVAEALPGRRLLFVPIDMPLLDPRLIRRLLTEAVDAVCVRFEDYALPMRLEMRMPLSAIACTPPRSNPVVADRYSPCRPRSVSRACRSARRTPQRCATATPPPSGMASRADAGSSRRSGPRANARRSCVGVLLQ